MVQLAVDPGVKDTCALALCVGWFRSSYLCSVGAPGAHAMSERVIHIEVVVPASASLGEKSYGDSRVAAATAATAASGSEVLLSDH